MSLFTNENRKRRLLALGAVVLLFIAILSGEWLLTGFFQKPTLSLYEGQWDSIRFNNALAGFIIRNGYGYPVVVSEETEHTIQTRIVSGEIDLAMELWQQNWIEQYNREIAQGTIVNLGSIYEAGPQFYIIPQWVADQYNISTIADMNDHFQLFQDPDNPAKGIFYNCIRGWSCGPVNEVKFEAYGLTRHYTLMTPPSDKALEAVFDKAQENHQPVFGYYWAPTSLAGSYDWYILKEPPYTDQCWKKVMAAVEDPNLRPLASACAYESPSVDKVANSQLLKKAPDVVVMVRKMEVGTDALNRELGWARKNNVSDWNAVAVHYLRNNEETWKTWVTPGAYAGIKKALEKTPP